MGGRGPVLSLERKHEGRNRVQSRLSVVAPLIPRCLTHHLNSLTVASYFELVVNKKF